MKVCILTYETIKESKPYYLKLVEALKKRFDSVLLGYIEHVKIKVESGTLKAYYKNTDMTEFDAILPRFGPSYVNFGYLVLKVLENKVYYPNMPESYLIANDKFRTLIVLSRDCEIPIPKTFLSCSRKTAQSVSEEMGGEVVIKRSQAKSGGKGVIYSKDIKSARSIIDAFPHTKGTPIFIEEYLKNPGEDIRLFVIGKEVITTAKRVAKEIDFRSNIHSGGHYEPYTASEELKRLAVRSAKAIGADICGVDVIPCKKGFVVIELNMNPGFKISEITGVNIFGRITDFFFEEATSFHKARKIENVFFDVRESLIEGFLSIFKKKQSLEKR